MRQDVTDYWEKHKGSGRYASVADVAAEIRSEIFRHTQLTASAGIACNPMLGKACAARSRGSQGSVEALTQSACRS